jgi:3-phosphoshikimate 1-carboxyvinyltransferase
VNVIVRRANSINGSIRVPGDKSISHRAAILAAIAEGETRIDNFSTAVDCRATLNCLGALGIAISRLGTTTTISGAGKAGLRPPKRPLDCGNSGTTARLLAGVLAPQPFDSVLIGDSSLRSRPMDRIIEPLRQMGARIESDNGRLPLRIFGGQELHGIQYKSPAASAQVKSCLLLAGLFATGKTTVLEPIATRDHTERLLQWMGASIEAGAVSGELPLTARDVDIPGDVSSAAFFVAAAACLPGSVLKVSDVGLNRARTAFIDLLASAGADIEVSDRLETCGEPRGSLTVRGGANRSQVIQSHKIPKLIDEIPILAVVGTKLAGGIKVRGAGELRHKETDRIAAMVENLRRMSATVEEFADGFRVERSQLKGAAVDPFGDHRVAMAFTVAGLLADGATEIRNSECVDISFPGFFDTLAEVVRYE